ncbi:hypothetical protein EDD18DRAFT_1226134 [Armillaria luteobubalina]|uniref:Uncharacterized protein n=1 Tax=Armillaria luteobubalina TaxID=153913 RepID=A0AA39TY71_9AGAR|nr:hypothetical protein EDD18DRAFT_1226134 [Armillaria luteobubalina]
MIAKRNASNAENIPVRRASSTAKHAAAAKALSSPAHKRKRAVAKPGHINLNVKTYRASKEALITVQLVPKLEKRSIPLPDAATLFARDNVVRDHGVRMFYTLSLLAPSAPPKDTSIPAKFPVSLPAHAPAEGPTCFLGVFAQNSTKVTLHPAHHEILATHCAGLPKGIQASPAGAEIPVHPLCLPDPQSYALLSQYMYTHRQDLLLASLFPLGSLPANPFPTAAHLSDSPKIAEEIHAQLLALAENLAKDYTQHKLLGGLSNVHGLWKNIVALGVDDDGLWEVLHAAWGVYLTAAGWTDGRLHLRKGELIPGFQ